MRKVKQMDQRSHQATHHHLPLIIITATLTEFASVSQTVAFNVIFTTHANFSVDNWIWNGSNHKNVTIFYKLLCAMNICTAGTEKSIEHVKTFLVQILQTKYIYLKCLVSLHIWETVTTKTAARKAQLLKLTTSIPTYLP